MKCCWHGGETALLGGQLDMGGPSSQASREAAVKQSAMVIWRSPVLGKGHEASWLRMETRLEFRVKNTSFSRLAAPGARHRIGDDPATLTRWQGAAKTTVLISQHIGN
jgi:hypothetical protein